MKEKILNLLKYCHRRRHTPDLHSFRAKINGGLVFVECSGAGNCVDIYIFTYDATGQETRTYWTGGLQEAAAGLEKLGMDPATVEM